MIQHLSLSKVVLVLVFIVAIIGFSAFIFSSRVETDFPKQQPIGNSGTEKIGKENNMDKKMIDEAFSKCYIFTSMVNYLQVAAGNKLIL